ncbi:DEKNAAC104941 [Brettanomyces naardenensis]|uniref:DEKNAAC104941 n=1 Tax=Brettanomyces naardenensis TaxID=13370 RepID=A0A448YRZ0_BRENA|nr:DEKNAAC104941 [Brettanomyces naardenensis]
MSEVDAILQEIRDGIVDFSKSSPLDSTTKTKYHFPKPSNEEINRDIKLRYLTPTNELTWDLLDEFQNVPSVDQKATRHFYRSLMKLPPLTDRTRIRFRRQGIDGSIVSYNEEFDFSMLESSGSASNSYSMKRKFSSKNRALMGSTSNLPFQPSGIIGQGSNDSTKYLHKDLHGLFDIPQGLERGLQLPSTEQPELKIEELGDHSEGNEEEIDMELAEPNDDDKLFEDEESDAGSLDDEISQIIPSGSVVRPSTAPHSSGSALQSRRKKEWPHMVELDHKIDNFDELVPNPARSWPFTLDVFQMEAIYHLEQGDSVFVAAHTSAGKTVVAEYAIAMAQRNMTKTIYTSPIKALSNQKFRDFKESFKDVEVGIITGDVQINPDANCLIMTTEILRSMLYRGADVLRDVEFVVFDEVHYVNDIDRGVVWEEVIIMLPAHIKIILLSATVPNTYEFASWVGRTKQKDIYVISTPKRPVPLEIDIWARDRPYKVIDSNRKFLEKGFTDHVNRLTMSKAGRQDMATRGRGGHGNDRGSRGRGGRGNDRGGNRGGRPSGSSFRKSNFDGPTKNTWPTLINYLRNHDLLPAVIFVFSKRKCEEYADTLGSVNFCTSKEASEIHMFIDKAVSRLKHEDRELPQILKIREMLKRGIAVHHGGLLPIVKEVVEILFSKSLIKVLFATETFAMGLNLPARTVVFSSLRKHDGTNFRFLLPGEFTQMSGRAGRRGIDKMGTVMVMSYSEPIDRTSFKETTLGTPTKLSSQFRLTYAMILNLLRIEALKVEDMIKRSFSENSSQSMIPERQMEVLKSEKDLKENYKITMEQGEYDILSAFYTSLENYRETYRDLIREEDEARLLSRIFRKNRVIVYRDSDNVLKPAVTTYMLNPDASVTCFCVDRKRAHEEDKCNMPFNPKFGKEYLLQYFGSWSMTNRFFIRKVSFDCIEFVSSESLDIDVNELTRKDKDAVHQFRAQFAEHIRNRDDWEEVNWKKPMTARTLELVSDHDRQQTEIIEKLEDPLLLSLLKEKSKYTKVYDRMRAVKKIEDLKISMSEENLELLPEYQQRLEVLKQLGYVDTVQMTVNLKGRVACEINCGWELVITELIFNNFLGDFSSEEIIALMSCFVYEGRRNKNDEELDITLSTPKLEKGKHKIGEIISKLTDIYVEKKITMTSEEETFLQNNRFGLVNTVYEWSRGQSFKEIMESANDADESEGTIVRVITFLDEICRQVKNAALIIGDADLHMKMNDAQEKIKRDIVFCASLYL